MTANRVVNDLRDLTSKANVIGSDTIRNVNRSEIANLNRENGRIGRSAQAFTAEENIAQLTDKVEQLANNIITELPILMDGLKGVISLLEKSVEGWRMIFDLLKNSALVKGIGSMFGKGKDK